MSLPLAVGVFLVAAAVLVRVGSTLAAAGDELAEETGLGGLFIGTLLIALATSLPEIATDITATLAGAPDLAVADLFGSSMANMAILAVIDLRHRGAVWPTVELGHARVAAVAIVLTSVAGLGIMTPLGFTVGWIGLDTILIAVLYIAAMAWLRRAPLAARTGRPVAIALEQPVGLSHADRQPSRRRATTRFGLAAIGILISAPVVALSAKQIADVSGIGQTLIGSTVVAVSTSLPELVVALAAVRIGAHDLAVGNLFGSNAANMSVLLILDIVYTKGAILSAIDAAQTTAAIGSILLMALAVSAIVGGTETRIWRLEPDATLLLVAYLGALAAIAAAAR